MQVGQLIAVMAEDGEDLAEAIKEAMASAGDGEAAAAPDSAPEGGKNRTIHTLRLKDTN